MNASLLLCKRGEAWLVAACLPVTLPALGTWQKARPTLLGSGPRAQCWPHVERLADRRGTGLIAWGAIEASTSSSRGQHGIAAHTFRRSRPRRATSRLRTEEAEWQTSAEGSTARPGQRKRQEQRPDAAVRGTQVCIAKTRAAQGYASELSAAQSSRSLCP